MCAAACAAAPPLASTRTTHRTGRSSASKQGMSLHERDRLTARTGLAPADSSREAATDRGGARSVEQRSRLVDHAPPEADPRRPSPVPSERKTSAARSRPAEVAASTSAAGPSDPPRPARGSPPRVNDRSTQRWNRSTTVDFPAPRLPVNATFSIGAGSRERGAGRAAARTAPRPAPSSPV